MFTHSRLTLSETFVINISYISIVIFALLNKFTNDIPMLEYLSLYDINVRYNYYRYS
jgi:hypothetical protein